MQATFLKLCVVAYGELMRHRKQNVHRNTDSNHRHRIDQTHHHEELGTQHRDKLWLTCGTFQKTTTQNTDTDSRAQRAQTHHQCSSDVQQCICHFHFLFLLFEKVKLINPFNDVPGVPYPCRPVSYTHLRAHETRHDL